MRRRISWLVVVTTSAVVAAFVIPLCLLVRTLAEDRAMAAADQEARSVAILVARVPDAARLRALVREIDRRGAPSTQVLTGDGRTLGSGPSMAGDPEVRRARSGEAFTVVDARGGRVLLPVVGPHGTAVARATVAPAELRQGVSRAWAAIVGLGVVLLALAVLLASRLGRRVSDPLIEVAATAHRLREGELDARAEVRGPEETRELARALNGLAERTRELLASERAAVGDLSHRLRTPVTALRLDSEGVADPELAERLGEHIATLQRTIDSIVHEARRPVRTDLPTGCDAVTAVRRRVEFWRPLADDQGRELRVDLPAVALRVPMAAEDLGDLVDVLVDNVFAHTAEGTGLRLELRPVREDTGPVAVLEVADAGPGLPVRDAAGPGPGPGRPDRAGAGTGIGSGATRLGTTGLGLDIARRAAAGSGGRLSTGRAPEGGALVTVVLPLLEG
ncbi:sensor histidine kinase [Nocardioides panaciterrulae]|uniref:histidine kinase n=1 Tax=Nocardioides panaciterrulae TaxID=661492 RepID=A0A7Y9E9B8_9ACTN|nr:HAMP domain-containing sensor histidine kinase [Nocardioides panaciterrulae]NYD43276.1 signal transduction histidine kinase [Nocardioides panaciterrulae]